MKESIRWTMLGFLFLTAAASTFADPVPCEIDGFTGVAPVGDESVVAIWISVPSGSAVTGIRWYNSDGTVVFPEVLLASGERNRPVDPSVAQVVATDVVGPTLAWCEVVFDQPYACQSGGLYCLFRLPPGSDYEAPGFAGGAGFGVTSGECGHEGWFGGTDTSWLRIVAPYGLAIEPMIEDADEGTFSMLRRNQGSAVVPTLPKLNSVYPSPFNPMTTFEFSLPQAMAASLTVYNVRGILVKTLVSGVHAAGLHTVTWLGEDDSGRKMPSGVYLARFSAGSTNQTQRLVLLK
jgi:hypothetical protein